MCDCNGGKPVNLNPAAGPPKVDPFQSTTTVTVVRKTLTRNSFVNLVKLRKMNKKQS